MVSIIISLMLAYAAAPNWTSKVVTASPAKRLEQHRWQCCANTCECSFLSNLSIVGEFFEDTSLWTWGLENIVHLQGLYRRISSYLTGWERLIYERPDSRRLLGMKKSTRRESRPGLPSLHLLGQVYGGAVRHWQLADGMQGEQLLLRQLISFLC